MQQILIAGRRRGDRHWTHLFSVDPRSWRNFYRHARRQRQAWCYARIVDGAYISVL